MAQVWNDAQMQYIDVPDPTPLLWWGSTLSPVSSAQSNGITWSNTPYGVMPGMSTGEVGGYSSAPQDWGFLPQLAVQLGMTPINPGGSLSAQGDWIPQTDVMGQTAQWLASNGYTPRIGSQGSTYINGIFDKNGNLVASQGLDSSKTSLADLTGLLTTVGLPALGGAALSGSLGSLGGIGDIFSGAAAPAAGNGAFLGEGIASGIPAWDAAATNAGLALSGAAAPIADVATGNGAFLGEGTSAGIPQWDAAMSNAVPAIPPSTPSVFNAAQDSQLANQQLGITGDQAAAAATAPSGVNLVNAGGEMATGIGTFSPLLSSTPSTGITPAQLQQGINAAKQLTGGNTPAASTQANNSGLASLLGALGGLGGLGGLGQQPGYAETAVNMGAINPFNVHGMDLATTPTTGIQAMPGQGQSPDLNTSAGLLRLLGITQ